jgi:hypothetical protein
MKKIMHEHPDFVEEPIQMAMQDGSKLKQNAV